MTEQEIIHEKEALAYLESLQTPDTSLSIDEFSEEFTLSQNDKIIKEADRLLLERLENSDGSLRITDIVSAKDSAFKLNRAILGKWDDWPQLIPSIINIQIINN